MAGSARTLTAGGPVIAVIADLRGATSQHVTDLVASLQAQIYPRWELWLVVPNGIRGLDWTARRLAGKDDRIQRRRIKGRSDYTSGLNAALNQSKADSFAFIPAHGRLSSDALLHVAEALQSDPDLKLLYTDEDRMEDDGRRHSAWMKGAWNPELAISGLFPGQLAFYNRPAVVALGGFRADFGLIATYDLQLRVGDELPHTAVRHLPLCLLSCAGVGPARSRAVRPLVRTGA
jgi:glycosyltransferase involved in cell wall biosynthesis